MFSGQNSWAFWESFWAKQLQCCDPGRSHSAGSLGEPSPAKGEGHNHGLTPLASTGKIKPGESSSFFPWKGWEEDSRCRLRHPLQSLECWASPVPGCCQALAAATGSCEVQERGSKELAGTTLWSVELSDLNIAIATWNKAPIKIVCFLAMLHFLLDRLKMSLFDSLLCTTSVSHCDHSALAASWKALKYKIFPWNCQMFYMEVATFQIVWSWSSWGFNCLPLSCYWYFKVIAQCFMSFGEGIVYCGPSLLPKKCFLLPLKVIIFR